MLEQIHFKNWRPNKMAQALHLEINKIYGLPFNEKWYDRCIEPINENKETTAMWDVKIQTGKDIECCSLDIDIRYNVKL